MKNIRPPQTFTAAVYRFLLADPETEITVRLWAADPADSDDRVSQFACRLSEDFAALFRLDGAPKDQALLTAWNRRKSEIALMADWLSLANRAVNWNAVARSLLNRFGGIHVRKSWAPALSIVC